VTVGFAGLGLMGEPMALNLVRSGTPVLVWNRTAAKCKRLQNAGALVAQSVDELFARCDMVILMLADASAVDEVLGRGSTSFASRVRSRLVVTMGTTSPEYSRELGIDIVAAGGSYVEAPVSGSRQPAIDAQLVAMVAGDPDDVERVRSVIAPMCVSSEPCGPVPGALLMKLSVNLYLITMVSGLCEAFHFARQHQLDLDRLRSVLDSGPMASAVSRGKLRKLQEGDFAAQAAARDVLTNSELVADAARRAGVAAPGLEVARALFAEAVAEGYGAEDMIAVVHAIEHRTRAAAR
jgi:3-hydroxyisobutyrate dehydrogenase